MSKRNTKPGKRSAAAKKPAKRKAPRKKRAAGFVEDSPPVMNAIQLGQRYGVTDETIRTWAKLAIAPAQVAPGRWRVAEFDRFVALLKEMGGPRGVEMHGEEAARRTAITGNVTPPPPAPDGGDESSISEHATTPTELLKLTPGALLKTKMAEDIITRRLANQERKRRLIPRADVEEILFARAQSALSFKRQMALELPPKLLGLDRPETEAKLGEALDELFRRIAMLGDPIGGPPAAQSGAVSPPAPDEKSRQNSA